jgi:hypothetical protein
MRPCRLPPLRLLAAVPLLAGLLAGPGPAVSASPATPVAAPAGGSKREQEAQRLFDYLVKQYAALFDKSKDRVGRSISVVCLARIPRADSTALLLKVLKTDRDPLVQMVAWQCLLGRAERLTEAEYRQWLDATYPLSDKGAFRGNLRVPLLQLLATAPPDARAKEAFSRCFAGTNSQDVEDRPTLEAMGEALRAWRDPEVVESVVNRLTVLHDAYRAEVVLHAAGCDVPWAASRRETGSSRMWAVAQQEYAAWWATERPSWKPTGPRPRAWRELDPQYVAPPDYDAAPNPDDKRWHNELELRPPNLRTFHVGLVVDATGSMGAVLAWLKSDVKRLMEAFGYAALEPQIAITFYRDHGDAFVTRSVPLTGDAEKLSKAIAQIDAKGGGDQPEAVREALAECLSISRWTTSDQARKALVLIGDAPPHPQTQADCERMLKDAAAAGFKLYVVKVRTGWESADWSALDRLAAAGNGSSIMADMRFGPQHGFEPDPRRGGKPAPPRAVRPRASRWLDRRAERTADHRPPGERVVTQVLVDAINPQFADRVQPPMAVLWQMLKDPTPEKHQHFPPPPKNDATKPKKPREPFDPQKQR